MTFTLRGRRGASWKEIERDGLDLDQAWVDGVAAKVDELIVLENGQQIARYEDGVRVDDDPFDAPDAKSIKVASRVTKSVFGAGLTLLSVLGWGVIIIVVLLLVLSLLAR